MSRDPVDAAFVRFQQRGAPQDLAEVFDATAAELLRVARHLVGDAHAAEDVVQATFVAAIESAASYDASRPVAAWLHGILANQARRHCERRQRAPDPQRLAMPPAVGPATGAEHSELTRAVDDAIARMPEAYQPVLRLHLGHGMPAPEIALALHRAPDTVRKQIARGLERLRTLLPAGLAGALAVWLWPSRGLAQVRSDVLAAAARRTAAATGAATAAATAAPLGVLAMKKLVVLCAGLVAAALVWSFWPESGSRAAAEGSLHSGAPSLAGDASMSTVAAAPPAAAIAEPGRSVVAAPKDALAALLVCVRWSDGTAAADIGVRLWANDLNERALRTDARGEARFADLEPGRVPVTLDRNVDHGVTLVRGEPFRLDLTIPAGVDVRGMVRDEAGAPIAGAKVWLSEEVSQHDGAFVTESDATGSFALRDVSPKQLVSATAEKYLPCELVEVTTGKVELVLHGPAGGAHGIVVDEFGQPKAAAVMAGWADSGGGSYLGSRLWVGTLPLFVRTDAQGRFVLFGLRLDRATPVFACAPGYTLCRAKATGGQAELIVLRLSRGATVEGIARDEQAAPFAGVTVATQLWRQDDHSPYWWCSPRATTGDDGAFRLEHIPAGSVALAAEKEGLRETTVTLELADGTTTPWHPVLRRAAAIAGVVVDGDGRPLAGLQVNASGDSGHSLEMVKTDADGRFLLQGCEAERYTVRVYEAEDWGRFPIAKKADVPAGGEARIEVANDRRGTGSLRATLLHGDRTPIAHADVWIWREPYNGGPRRTTDAAGRLVADHLPPANYKLQAHMPDQPMLDLGIQAVGPGEARDLGEIVIADPGRLEVEVFLSDGSRPDDGWVRLLRTGKRNGRDAWAGGFRLQNGAGRSEPLEPGAYTLVVWSDTVPRTLREVAVRGGEVARVRLDVEACVRRTIVLVKPVAQPDIEVAITWFDGDGAVLDENGGGRWPKGMAAEIQRAFAPGTYRVVVVDDKRGLRGERTFTIAAGDPATGRIEVELK